MGVGSAARGVVRGRLRRPCRPLQVIGVLATVLPIARKSRQFSCSDRAMLALQRQPADDPGLIPEPSFKAAPVIRPLLIRLCSVAALAAFVAWGVVSYSDVKKTAGIATSTPAIVSKHVSDVQPSRLPPTPSQTTVARIPVGDSRPVAIASADAAAVKSMLPRP